MGPSRFPAGLFEGFYGRLSGGICGNIAWYLRLLGCGHAALHWYGRAIRLRPRCWRGYYERSGLLFRGLHRPVDALEDIESALSLNPGEPALYEARAHLYLSLEEYGKALRNFVRLAGDRPKRKDLLYWQALCWQGLGNDWEALQRFSLDLDGNPERFESLLGLAECQLGLEKYSAASATAGRGLKLRPADEDILACAVRAELGRGRCEAALLPANRLVAASNCAAYAYDLRADALEGCDELERALKDRQQAVKLKPDSAEYWNTLALLYDRLEKTRTALKCLNKAVRLAPDSPVLYRNRGGVLEDLDELDRASRDYDTAIELERENPDNYYFKARVMMDLDRWEESERNLALALRLTNRDPYCFYLRGKVYERKKELAKALADYSKAIELFLQRINSEICRPLRIIHILAGIWPQNRPCAALLRMATA